jgi:hypothetical protein
VSDVTDGDREKAWQAVFPGYVADRIELVAAALAEEREKARMPKVVLDLVAEWQNRADQLDEESEIRGRGHLADQATGLRIAATALDFTLRRAAGEA